MSLSLDQIKIGDVLSYWYDSGCFGYKLYYVTVVKIGSKKIRVRFEQGNERWKYPSYFVNEIVPESTVQELRNDGVDI